MKIFSRLTTALVLLTIIPVALSVCLFAAALPQAADSTPDAVQSTFTTSSPFLSGISGFIHSHGIALSALLLLLVLGFVIIVLRNLKISHHHTLTTVQDWLRGNFSNRIPSLFFEEQQLLARTLNSFAERVEESQFMLQRENQIGSAIFASMSEGVIAVDLEERIIAINPAARELLQLENSASLGQVIQEVIRSRELHLLIENILKNGVSAVQTIGLRLNGDRQIEVRGSLLTVSLPPKVSVSDQRTLSPQQLGVLLTLSDTTQLRKLEKVRRDFVANVSHELRTPITSIKGFVETLLDGAQQDPAVTTRFLEIVRRHTDRLSGIIDDLLALTKVEDEADRNTIVKQQTQVSEMISSVLELATLKADEKRLSVDVECDTHLSVKINRNLMEQAITNLVENAVKYSDAGGKIKIRAATLKDSLQVSVEDNGIGISKEHLPRLFERFYRVDRARTREQGGSGLGLAIVKHIATVHGGDITAESELGKGSRFILSIPLSDSH